MFRKAACAVAFFCLSHPVYAECDIAECTPRACIDFQFQETLPGFPAHETDTTPEQRDAIRQVAQDVANGLDQDGTYRCARIVGHSSSWRGLSAEEYDLRSVLRAKVTAELFAAVLETSGAVPIIIPEEDLLVEEFCMISGAEDFVIIYGGQGNSCPKVDNQVESTSSAARTARYTNRRVEIYLVPEAKPFKVRIDWDKPCPDVMSDQTVCVEVLDGIYQGTQCSHDAFMSTNSKADLLEMVERGEARLICKP